VVQTQQKYLRLVFLLAQQDLPVLMVRQVQPVLMVLPVRQDLRVLMVLPDLRVRRLDSARLLQPPDLLV
jgi:hypothetical protein